MKILERGMTRFRPISPEEYRGSGRVFRLGKSRRKPLHGLVIAFAESDARRAALKVAERNPKGVGYYRDRRGRVREVTKEKEDK